MKYPRPVGLVLVTLVSMTCSMPAETASRYISFEGYTMFSPKMSHKIPYSPLNYSNLHILSHFSDNKYSHDNSPNESTKSDRNREERKTKFTKLDILSTSKKPMINSTSNFKSSKVNFQKISSSSPNVSKKSNIALGDKKRHRVITTKAPVKVRKTTQVAPHAKVTTSAPVKVVTIKTKILKSSTPKGKPKRPTYVMNISNSAKPTSSLIKRKRPTVQKVVTKWSDTSDLSEIKQNWYEEGIPYPNPNPEISSFSPSFSLSDLSSISPLSSDSIDYISNLNPMPEITSHSPPYFINGVPEVSLDPPVVEDVPLLIPESADAVSNPLSVFNLDMVPDQTKTADGNRSPCPSVHISSSVLNPQQRQECSDLNLVINSHIHQNGGLGDTRNPAISTYDSQAPLADAVSAAADPVVDAVAADTGVASAADPGIGAAQAAVPSPASAGSGGSGGTGGNGGNGDNGPWKFPDLKHMFEAIGYIWNGLGYLLSFLRNPYLYIIPMVLFFLLGFFKVLALFPWWIPILLLYLGVKKHKPQQSITFTKHIHKPVHHADGWFWNHRTKTWQNVQDFSHKRRNEYDSVDYDGGDSLSQDLNRIHKIYARDNNPIQTWKVRKRSKR